MGKVKNFNTIKIVIDYIKTASLGNVGAVGIKPYFHLKLLLNYVCKPHKVQHAATKNTCIQFKGITVLF